MNTINISNNQLRNMIKKKNFNSSELIRCDIKNKEGVPIIFTNLDSFKHTLEQLLGHFEPNEITNISPRFNKFKTKHTATYKYHENLGIWLQPMDKNGILKCMNEFMKAKKMKFDLIFRLQDQKCYRYTTNYKNFNYIPPDDDVFYDCESTCRTPVDINNEGFEETKGEEATREAEMNEQCDKKNKWRIRRYNDKGIVIKETKVQFLNSLINNNNWPEIINKDTHYNIRKRPTKNLQNLNITIDKLTK